MSEIEPDRRLVATGTSDAEKPAAAKRDEDPRRVDEVEEQERQGWPDEPTTS